jgi:hypothetical protein
MKIRVLRQVPSTSTVVSRNVIWGSDITFTITGALQPYEYLWNGVPINQTNNNVVVQGADNFAPFVLHQLTNNMTCQINNTSVVQNNVNQILDPILRGLNKHDIEKLYGSTPTQLDYWALGSDSLPQQNVNAGALAASVKQSPLINTWNSPFNSGAYQNTKDLASRASFEIVSIDGNTPAGAAAVPNKAVTIKIRVREPLLLSPFLFCGSQDETGIVGITQLNFTMSMDASAKRALRWVLSNTVNSTKAVSNVVYTQPYMEFLYYTPPPTMLIPSTCVTPLQSFVDFILPNTGAVLGTGLSDTYTSNAFQLNSIPDKVVIWVDDVNKQESNLGLGNTVSDHYATITGVNITFNNQTGILSNFSQKQLFDASLKSGSQQSYDEFTGLVNVGGNSAGGDVVFNKGTCGSVLYLNFGDVININEVYSAPGSLQTSQIVVRCSFTNYTGGDIKPQLNCMFLYSGILSTTNGNSASYLNGILTRNDVLNSANAPHMVKKELTRYVGSGVLSDMKSMASNYLPMAKRMLDAVGDNKYAKLGAQALDTLGYGVNGGISSAGISSAGISSAGRMHSKMMR